MSGFIGTRALSKENWKNSVASSDILSTSALPSSISVNNDSIREWVLFSPAESLAEDPTNDQSENSELIDEFGLRSAEHNRQFAIEDSYVSGAIISGLELPSHNGSGAFNLEQTNERIDLFNRVNTWRLDQANHDVDTEIVAANSRMTSPWQLLKNAAASAWHSLVDLDDQSIDALMGAHFDEKNSPDPLIVTSPHLYHARQRGPPGWEKKMINHVTKKSQSSQNDTGLVFAILARMMMWKQKTVGLPGTRPLTEPVNPGHSYHYPEIQRSIASLTASIPSSSYSESWGTSISNSSLLAT